MTTDTARENSGAIANNFDKDKVQSEINLQIEVTKKFDQNRQEVKAEINKKIDQAKSENQSILDKQEGGIPLSREEEQQLAAYNKKVENYQQLGVLLDVVTSGLSSPTSSGLGIAASSLSPAASYEIGQYFKEKGTEGSSAHILAHTVLGAAVAAAGGNDALTAGLVAGGAEAAAPALSSFLYNKKTSDLTADEKSTISAITGLVATGIGGIASGGDIATAVQSGQGAQNAVENNYLSELDVKILVEELNQAKTEVEKEEIYKKFAELSKEKSELAAIECIDVESLGCKQEIINIKNGLNFINDQNAVIDYLAYERVDNKIEPMDGGLHLEIVKSFDAGSLYFEISKSPQTYEEYKNQTEVRFVEYENLSDLSKYANSELSSDIKKYLGSKDYEYSNQPFLDKPWGSMYVAPALQIVGGGLTVAGAAVIGGTLCETVIGCVVAGYLAGSGGDDIRNGGINWGQEPIAHQATLREQLLRSMGMSEGAAAWTTLGLDFGTGLGAAKLVLKPNFIPELNKYPSELSSKDMFVDNNFNAENHGFGSSAIRDFQPGTTHRAENINAGQVTDRDGLVRVDKVKEMNDIQVGGWATDTPINSITDVRNKLAVPEEWKSGRLYTVEFVAKPGTNVREGTVGDMWSNSSKERLPGGGHQVEFKTAPRDNSPLFEIISVPKEIK